MKAQADILSLTYMFPHSYLRVHVLVVFLSLFVQIILLQWSEPSFKKAGYINYLETQPVVERHRYRVCPCAPLLNIF